MFIYNFHPIPTFTARKPEFNETDTNAAFLNNTKGTLRCQSNAIPRANYTWTKNGIPIIPGTKYDVIDGNILVVNGMTGDDRGEYKCIAENVFGKAEKVINVTIGMCVCHQIFTIRRNLRYAGCIK